MSGAPTRSLHATRTPRGEAATARAPASSARHSEASTGTASRTSLDRASRPSADQASTVRNPASQSERSARDASRQSSRSGARKLMPLAAGRLAARLGAASPTSFNASQLPDRVRSRSSQEPAEGTDVAASERGGPARRGRTTSSLGAIGVSAATASAPASARSHTKWRVAAARLR